MKKLIIAAALMLVLSSCEKVIGCGTVVGGGREFTMGSNVGTCYFLRVKFGSTIKKVYVDERTYLSYGNNSSICF